MSTTTKVKQPGTLRRLTKHSEFTIGLVVIALFLLATFLTKNFFGSYNLKNLTKQGAIIGVLLLQIIFAGLNFLSVDANYLYIVKGLIILIACAIDMRKYLVRK